MTLPSSFLKPHWFLLFLFSISTSNISQCQRFVLEGWVLLGPTRLLKGQITWFFKHKQHKKLTWAHIYKRRHVHTFALTLTSAIRNMQESSKIQFQFVETYIAVFGPVFDVSFPPYLLTVSLLTGSWKGWKGGQNILSSDGRCLRLCLGQISKSL